MTIESENHEILRAPNIPKTAYMLVGIVVSLLILIMGGGILYANNQQNRDNNAQDVRERQACIAELNSDVLIAFGDAFGTSPASIQTREQAIQRIHTKAEILKHAGSICTPSLDRAVYRRVASKAKQSH